jgi:hypothetical protein
MNEATVQPTLTPVVSETPTNQVPIDLEISSIDSFTDREFIHANLRISGNPNIRIQNIDFSKIDLINGSGEKIGIEPINLNRDYNPEIYPLGIATTSKTDLSAMKLVISDISFVIENPNLQLTVNYGDHPYDGETIEINQYFSCYGEIFKIEKISLHVGRDNETSQTIEVSSDGELVSISFTSDDLLHFPEESLSGNKILVETFFRSQEFPTGKENITIDSLVFHQNGPWVFYFDPQNIKGTTFSKNSGISGVCLPPSKYENLIRLPPSKIPNDANGFLLTEAWNFEKGSTYSVIKIPENRIIYQIVDNSSDISSINLSHDGRYLFFSKGYEISTSSKDSGSPPIYVIDLLSFQEKNITQELGLGENIIFSDDNKWFAYRNGEGKINIHSLPDFQLFRQISGVVLIGWIDNDHSLLWWRPVPKAAGGYIKSTNIETDQMTKYFDGNFVYGPFSLSGNNKQLIFGEKIPQTETTGYYFSNLDGSNKSLFFYSSDSFGDLHFSWAPMGEDIILSVQKMSTHSNFLINLETCETILLDLPNVNILQWVNEE